MGRVLNELRLGHPPALLSGRSGRIQWTARFVEAPTAAFGELFFRDV